MNEENKIIGGFKDVELKDVELKDVELKDNSSMLFSPLDGKEEVFPGVIRPEHYKSIIERCGR